MRLMLAFALALLSTFAVACNESRETRSPSHTASATRDGRLSDVVLTLADVPQGWHSEPAARGRQVELSTNGCADGVTAIEDALERVQSEILVGDDALAANTAERFSSESAANEAFSSRVSAYNDCRDEIISASATAFAADPATSGHDAKFSVEPLDLQGDVTTGGFQSLVTVDGADSQSVDIVYVQVGDILCTLTYASVDSSHDLVRQLASILAAKASDD
jgi:hypothetical protein